MRNEDFFKGFTAMGEIDEIYVYCREMGLTSSEEEFDEEVSSIIDNFDIYLSQIDKNDLNLVAGEINLNKKFNKVLALALSALAITGVGAVNNGFAVEGASDQAISRTTSVVSSGRDVYKDKAVKNASVSRSLGDKVANVMAETKRFVARHKLGLGITVGAIVAARIIFVVLYKFPGSRPWTWFPSDLNTISGSDDVATVRVGETLVTVENVNTIDYSTASFSEIQKVVLNDALLSHLTVHQKDVMTNRVMTLSQGILLKNDNEKAVVQNVLRILQQ